MQMHSTDTTLALTHSSHADAHYGPDASASQSPRFADGGVLAARDGAPPCGFEWSGRSANRPLAFDFAASVAATAA